MKKNIASILIILFGIMLLAQPTEAQANRKFDIPVQQVIFGLQDDLLLDFLLTLPDTNTNNLLMNLQYSGSKDYIVEQNFSLRIEYDTVSNRYFIHPVIQNSRTIKELVLQVYDQYLGNELPNMRFVQATNMLEEPFEVSARDFVPDRVYCFRLSATRQDGSSIVTDKGDRVLSEYCETYQPHFGFALTSYQIDYQANTIQINFDVRGAGNQLLRAQGRLLEENGEVIEVIEPRVLDQTSMYLTLPIPQEMRKHANGQNAFRFDLMLSADNQAPISPYYVEKFIPPAAPMPSITAVLGSILKNPVLWIGMILFGIAIVVMLKFRRSLAWIKSKNLKQGSAHFNAGVLDSNWLQSSSATQSPTLSRFDIKAPPVGYPVVLRIHILEHKWCTGIYEISALPLIIGRGKDAHFQIPGDVHLSKKHVRIEQSYQDSNFKITWIGKNPITINNNQALQNFPVPFTSKIIVKLTQETSIVIEPV